MWRLASRHTEPRCCQPIHVNAITDGITIGIQLLWSGIVERAARLERLPVQRREKPKVDQSRVHPEPVPDDTNVVRLDVLVCEAARAVIWQIGIAVQLDERPRHLRHDKRELVLVGNHVAFAKALAGHVVHRDPEATMVFERVKYANKMRVSDAGACLNATDHPLLRLARRLGHLLHRETHPARSDSFPDAALAALAADAFELVAWADSNAGRERIVRPRLRPPKTLAEHR